MVSDFERRKDLVQELAQSTALHVGEIAKIIATTVASVTKEIGEIVTDGFEMRDAAKRAAEDDAEDDAETGAANDVNSDVAPPKVVPADE